ncbi:MAG: hypothetical protein IPG22_06505 [Acidobacteria bacterium]|nr:hypothetical protein [Acidobacteriota bacterium]
MSENMEHNHERRISLLEQANVETHRAMDAANKKLDLILAQTTRMAVLEEKHQAQQVDVSRAHDRVADLEAMVNMFAIETRAFIEQHKGRDKVLWALSGVVFGLLIKALFFASSHGMTP